MYHEKEVSKETASVGTKHNGDDFVTPPMYDN
jgi:hypothetical protein